MDRIDTDVLVIGAGPAGACAASLLVRQGHRVLCLDRDRFPRFVIGESLLTRCNDLLAESGLLPAVESRRYMVKRGALFLQGDQRSRVWFANGLPGDQPSTFQVPRDDFDQALATAARAMGVDVRFGMQIEAVDASPGACASRVTDLESGEGIEVRSRFVLDCSGYGRVLPRLFDLEKPAQLPPRTAVFSHYEGDVREEGIHEGDIWIVIHPWGGWMWVIPFSNGRTSIGIVADPEVIERVPGSDRDKLSAFIRSDPAVAERFARAAQVLDTRRLHGWSKKVTRWHGPGWAVAGNAGDFLDPVFSSGVLLALESASLAARGVDRALRGEPFDWMGDYEDRMAVAVRVFKAFVESWYRGELPRIFFATTQANSLRRMVTSILAGYCLNEQNVLVRDPEAGLGRLYEAIEKIAARRSAPA